MTIKNANIIEMKFKLAENIVHVGSFSITVTIELYMTWYIKNMTKTKNILFQ